MAKKLVSGRFSKEEIKVLKKMFCNTSTKKVALKLNRKAKAVDAKAEKMGLRKTKKYLKSAGLMK